MRRELRSGAGSLASQPWRLASGVIALLVRRKSSAKARHSEIHPKVMIALSLYRQKLSNMLGLKYTRRAKEKGASLQRCPASPLWWGSQLFAQAWPGMRACDPHPGMYAMFQSRWISIKLHLMCSELVSCKRCGNHAQNIFVSRVCSALASAKVATFLWSLSICTTCYVLSCLLRFGFVRFSSIDWAVSKVKA